MWKLTFKHFGLNVFANTLLMLQFVIMFLAAITISSGISSRFQDYLPFRSMLEQQGDYYVFMTSFVGKEELKANLKGDFQLDGCYHTGLGIETNGCYNDQDIYTMSYDAAWLEAYAPELQDGNWFQTGNADDRFIPVVISNNHLNFSLGDQLILRDGDSAYPAKIIGVIKDGARILTAVLPQDTRSFRVDQMYQDFDPKMEEKMLILIPERCLARKRGVESLPIGQFLIRYPNGISVENRKSNDNFIKKAGMVGFSCDTDTLRERSISYIYESVKLFFPIILSVLILVMTSIISMSALFTKRQLRNYAVYYICGARWKRCLLISQFSTFLIVISALLVSIAGIIAFRPLLFETVVKIGQLQLATCGILSVIFLLVSMIMPVHILRTQTVKDVLSRQ